MATDDSCWQIDNNWARLRTELLQADIQLCHPGSGISGIRYDDTYFPRARLFQLSPHHPGAGREVLAEAYVRGCDLIATFAAPPPHAAWPRVYWRALPAFNRFAAIELIMAMQTNLLDSNPRLHSRSHLPESDIIWMAAGRRASPVRLSPQSIWVAPKSEAGACLFRISSHNVSYAEMVLPADFQGLQIRLVKSGLIELSYRLFSERLEKGVIRLARARGVFLPAEDDQRLVADCYHNMSASGPPLTT